MRESLVAPEAIELFVPQYTGPPADRVKADGLAPQPAPRRSLLRYRAGWEARSGSETTDSVSVRYAEASSRNLSIMLRPSSSTPFTPRNARVLRSLCLRPAGLLVSG